MCYQQQKVDQITPASVFSLAPSESMEKHTWKSALYPGKGHRPAGLFLSPAYNIQVLLPAHHQGLKTLLPTLPPHPGFCPFSTIQTNTHTPSLSFRKVFTRKPRLSLNSRLACFSLTSSGIKGVSYTPGSKLFELFSSFFLFKSFNQKKQHMF